MKIKLILLFTIIFLLHSCKKEDIDEQSVCDCTLTNSPVQYDSEYTTEDYTSISGDMDVTVTIKHCPYYNMNTGAIWLDVTGGAPPYTYMIIGGNTTSYADSTYHNLNADSYLIRVSDSYGDYIQTTVTVNPGADPGLLMIPSFITPNNDGKNDTWYIAKFEAGSENSTIEIFDSKEKLVFEYKGNDYSINAWEGTDSKGKVKEGKYSYKITFHIENPRATYFIEGNVCVITEAIAEADGCDPTYYLRDKEDSMFY